MNLIKKIFFTILICSFLVGGERIAVATKVIGSVEFIRGKDFSKSLKKGHIIKKSDLTMKKPGNGISYEKMKNILGKKLKKDVSHQYLLVQERMNLQIFFGLKENYFLRILIHYCK